MTDRNWNREDYLISFEDFWEPENDLTNISIRAKIFNVHKYLYEGIFTEISRSIKIDNTMSALVLTLATIDYLAGYYSGQESGGEEYKKYLRKYFPKDYNKYIDSIWIQIRNGLIHNLVTHNPSKDNEYSFTLKNNSKDHLKLVENRIIFSANHFLIDTERSWRMYSHSMMMENINRENFIKRFNQKGGISSAMIKS